MATPDHQEDEQVILEQIKPETSGEAKMTKLKVSYFGHSMRKQGFLEKAIMLGNAESNRKEEDQMWDGLTP